MRRIVTWAMSTLSVLVLLFGYGTSRSSQAPAATAGPAAAAGVDTSSGMTSGGTDSGGMTSGGTAPTAEVFAGDEVMTPYGIVQVQITVLDGEITEADVLQVPWSNGHDQMINSHTVPLYNERAVAAQSADIDVVSGATVTWGGYTESLQSAIDQANL